MRIVHIINNLERAGAETLLCDTALAMARAGHDVHVVTLFAYTEESLRARLRDSLVTLHDIGARIRYDVSIALRLRAIIRQLSPQVVHAHLFPALYWTAIARVRGPQYVVTEHSTLNRRRTNTLLRLLDQFFYKRYTRIVCISEIVRSAFLNAYPALAARTVTVHNGIDLEAFRQTVPHPRAHFGLPEGVPVAIMVSRMEPRYKDHATVIRALTLVPTLYLVFAGTGPAEPALRRLASELGVEHRVHFLGLRNDIAQLMKSCDICIQSSTYEGFCLVLVEAMACGLPVIASNFGGVEHVVIAGKTADLFPIGDHESLAQRITALLVSPERMRAYGAAGIERSKEFGIERTVDRLLGVYGDGKNV